MIKIINRQGKWEIKRNTLKRPRYRTYVRNVESEKKNQTHLCAIYWFIKKNYMELEKLPLNIYCNTI